MEKTDPRDYSLLDYANILLFQREQLLEAAVGRMDPDTRAKLMALANSRSEDGGVT